MARTTLWYVYLTWENMDPVVTVSDQPLDGFHYDEMRIRTANPKAAGRVYIRNNLAHRVASGNHETTNPCSPTYGCMEQKWIERERRYEKRAVVRVVKSQGRPRKKERVDSRRRGA